MICLILPTSLTSLRYIPCFFIIYHSFDGINKYIDKSCMHVLCMPYKVLYILGWFLWVMLPWYIHLKHYKRMIFIVPATLFSDQGVCSLSIIVWFCLVSIFRMSLLINNHNYNDFLKINIMSIHFRITIISIRFRITLCVYVHY